MSTSDQVLGQAIEAHKDDVAKRVVDEQWARNPQFQARYGDTGHAKCVQDVTYNLSYLSQAIASDSPPLFASYIDWVRVLFDGLDIPAQELAESLEITRDVLHAHFPDADATVEHYIAIGLKHAEQESIAVPSFFDPSQPLSELARQYLDALRRGERAVASRLILDAVAGSATVKDIYLHVFQPSQREIGRLWQMNQLSVAQEHYCTAATQLIMSQLYPHIFSTSKHGRRLVATCVGGELHEIGLRMVADFFELEGWDTYYLGPNMPASSIVQTLIDRDADVLAISATMTFHLKLVNDLIARVRAAEAENGKRIRILVGGYPFNIDSNLWQRVSADGYAPDAEHAIMTADALMNA